MNRLRLSLFALVALVLLLTIAPVSAETISGNLSVEGWRSANYYFGDGNYGPGGGTIMLYYIYNIETTGTAKSLVHFDAPTKPIVWHVSNANQSGYTHFNWTYSGQVIATGTIGYQRAYNSAWPIPAEIGGFQYWQFDTWNTSGLTGTITVSQNIIKDGATVNWPNWNGLPWYWNTPASNATLYNPDGAAGYMDVFIQSLGHASGTWTYNKDSPLKNAYNATKPSGVGITGWVIKSEYDGSPFKYNSRAYITEGTAPYTLLTSESTISDQPFYFNVPAQTIKVCVRDSNGEWTNSSKLFNTTTGVTPTTTPIVPAVYTLEVNTQYVNVSGTNYATISSLTDPDLDDITALYYSYDNVPFYEVGSTVHQTGYELIGGTWYGYDSADVEYNNEKAGIPSNVTLKWDTTPGQKTLNLHYRTSGGIEGDLTKTIYVGQGNENLVQTSVQAMDGMNGGVVQMVQMQFYNHNTATWTNLSPNTGLGSILTPANHIISVYVQKDGFTDGQLLNKPVQDDYTYTVNLYRASAPAAGFVNEFVSVQAPGGGYITGATITITNATDGAVKRATTPTSGGAVIFNLTANSLHTYTVVKTGYQTQSGSFTTPASGLSQYLDVRMPYGSVITTQRTTAPIPTGSWTVNPSMTPAHGGNLTGFWSPWINVFSQMGASSYEMPLLLAGLIIIISMAAGFGLGGVLGGEVFMGFGAIFCVALGLIPIWVVLAIIVLGFLFYGLKIGGR